MSASTQFVDSQTSRSRTASHGRGDSFLAESSEPTQTTEESARDRLRGAALRTGGSERESVPDAADPEHRPARIDTGAGTTPFKSDRHDSKRGRSVRASHETPDEGHDATKLASRKKSLRREPQHVASVHPQKTPPKDTTAAGQKREAHDPGLQRGRPQDDHVVHAQKNGATQKIYCGNNALAHELTSGQARIGKRSECFRKGVGGGLHAAIPEGGTEEFIKKWTAPYRKLIEQPLHYGDGPTPAGKFPATLSQCLARGFAVGSIQKAKKKMHEPK